MLLIIAVKRMIYVIKHYCLGRVSVDCEVLFFSEFVMNQFFVIVILLAAQWGIGTRSLLC